MTAELLPKELDDLVMQPPSVDIRKRLKEICQEASNLNVTEEIAFRKITYLYSQAKDWEKKIEHARKEANAPDQERINFRNDKAKELLIPLKEIQQIAKNKSEQYQLHLEESKKEEEKKIQEAIDILGLEEVAFLPSLDKTVRGDGAMMFTRTVRKFRIVDESKIPDKYFMVNLPLIDQEIKMGIGHIDGIEIYDEKITQLRTR